MATAKDVAFLVRQNSQIQKNAVEDLLNWEADIKAKDAEARRHRSRPPSSKSRLDDVPAVSPSGGAAEMLSAAPIRSRTTTSITAASPGSVSSADSALKKQNTTKSEVNGASARAEKNSSVSSKEEPKNNTKESQVRPTSTGTNTAPDSANAETQDELDPKLRKKVEDALLEKEKGNLLFKKGEYKKAITCYSKSISLDPTSPVVPVNRAMAYLKLNEWKLAENDCSSGLQLDPKNVKALWRRGIARRELGRLEEAKSDLSAALVLEPGNKAIVEELGKVTLQLRSEKSPELSNNSPNPSSKTASPNAPTWQSEKLSAQQLKPRRRIEIHEIGDPSKYKATDEEMLRMEPISSRPLSNAVSEPTDSSKPQSSKPSLDAVVKGPSRDKVEPVMVVPQTQPAAKKRLPTRIMPSAEFTEPSWDKANALGNTDSLKPDVRRIKPTEALSENGGSGSVEKSQGLTHKRSSSSLLIVPVEEEDEGLTSAKSPDAHFGLSNTGPRRPLITIVGEDKDKQDESSALKDVSSSSQHVTPVLPIESTPPAVPETPPPTLVMSMFEFEREWKSCKGNDEKLFNFFKRIHPSHYPRMFKTSLEAHYLSKIFKLLLDFYTKEENSFSSVTATLQGLAKVERCDMMLMFLSSGDKSVLQSIFQWLDRVGGGKGRKTVAELNKFYKMKY
ncbi:hypothetical protein DFJ73DRAFT_855026 [Zopfochytrium polystomum]|nr:hypothetical protein DFJ73DRAFT_855026 [Zopfochytrium polystomum]